MVNKYFDGIIPIYNGRQNEVDEELENIANEKILKVEELIEKFEFANALSEIWNLISRTNKYIDTIMYVSFN